MWGTLIDRLITTYDNAQGRNCQPVLLLIDEAGRTAIPSLAEWIAVQSLAQLDAVYGRTRASVLRDNMETQLYYRPSNQETADYLQHCLGRRSDYAHSQTIREGEKTSEGRSEQGIPLLTSQEIKQMKDEDIIGFHRLLPPFRAKRMDWRNFPSLVLRQAMPAPQLAMLPDLADSLLTPALERPQYFADGYIDPDME
jgi:type IV secretory pathway TraG/TraD family ATPase VirD4